MVYGIIYGNCPRCGCNLVKRSRRSDGNLFVGCSGYPNCKFVCDYNSLVERTIDNFINEYSNNYRSNNYNGNNNLNSKTIKDLIFFAHPDRNNNSDKSNQITKLLLNLLEK
jgi:ssDNA-binding Zn-finger/Zn-ribbon topoisomerase 1